MRTIQKGDTVSRSPLLTSLIVGLWSIGGGAAGARPPEPSAIETLERRVAQLEDQNRAILAALAELKDELARQRSQPAAAPAPAAPAAGGAGAHAAVAGAAGVPAPRGPAAVAAAAPAPSGSVEGRDQPPAPREVAVGTGRLAFYGFLRLDAIYDDSRPDHPQFPSFILSEDTSLGPAGDDQFNLHPRLTRFGMNYRGPEIGGAGEAELSGKLEIDFQNGGRESREIPRLRHGWLKVSGEEWSLLAGQTWDLISPLYPAVNGDSLMWNAGNLGDRRPQVRFDYQPAGGPFSLAGGVGLTGAIDAQDLDGDGVRDGDDSSLPNVQLRVGAAGTSAGGRGWSAGLSGHYGWEETTAPVAGATEFASSSLGVDFELDLGERATVKGEAWTGRNLSDFRGGVGQGVNPVSGEEIDSRGGWLEVGLALADGYALYGGLALDDPADEDVPAGGRIENRAWYLVGRFPVARSLVLGLDYLRWTTEYQGLDDGTDDRFNLYLVYDL
jgi:hypothetical protein